MPASPAPADVYSAHPSGTFSASSGYVGRVQVGGVLLWLRFGVADTSCHSGTQGSVDSKPLSVAPLHLGSPWRSAAERFGASSLGFDMARCRDDPSRTGHCAHRLGLARRTNRTRPPGNRPPPLPGAPRQHLGLLDCCKVTSWRRGSRRHRPPPTVGRKAVASSPPCRAPLRHRLPRFWAQQLGGGRLHLPGKFLNAQAADGLVREGIRLVKKGWKSGDHTVGGSRDVSSSRLRLRPRIRVRHPPTLPFVDERRHNPARLVQRNPVTLRPTKHRRSAPPLILELASQAWQRPVMRPMAATGLSDAFSRRRLAAGQAVPVSCPQFCPRIGESNLTLPRLERLR
jgi:hypothetical protein